MSNEFSHYTLFPLWRQSQRWQHKSRGIQSCRFPWFLSDFFHFNVTEAVHSCRSLSTFHQQEFQYLVIRKALPTQPSWSQEMIEPIEPTIDLGIENYSLALDSRPELDISDDEDDVSMLQIALIVFHSFSSEQAAVYHSNAHTPTIEYHIILSPTYRVPVLYFFLHNLSIQRTSSIDAIQLLVPEHLKSGIKDIGVIGGISMAVRDRCKANSCSFTSSLINIESSNH